MLVLLFAAHQGEEFVLILPAIMLVGAFIVLRWANQPTEDGEAASDEPKQAPEQVEELEEEQELEVVGTTREAHQ
jgi:transposase